MLSFLNQNRLEIILYLLWIFLLLFIYFVGPYFIQGADFTDGYILGGDSSRFITAATEITKGNFSNINYASAYMGYDLFLALILFVQANLFSVVLLQIMMTGIAAYCLLKIGEILWSKNIGRLALMLFLFYIPIQIFNFYIVTESIYISLTIIGIYILIRNNKPYNLLIGCLILIYSSLVRPHGIVLIPLIFFYFFILMVKFDKKILIIISLILFFIISVPLFFFIEYILTEHEVSRLLLRGEIIWSYSKIQPPNKMEFIKSQYVIYDIIQLIINYPFYFIELISKRFVWFILRVRPYYSDIHNAFLYISATGAYFFCIIGFLNKSKKLEIKIILLTFILLTTFTVILTWADWDSRFSLPILPFIFLFTSSGIFTFLKKIF